MLQTKRVFVLKPKKQKENSSSKLAGFENVREDQNRPSKGSQSKQTTLTVQTCSKVQKRYFYQDSAKEVDKEQNPSQKRSGAVEACWARNPEVHSPKKNIFLR